MAEFCLIAVITSFIVVSQAQVLYQSGVFFLCNITRLTKDKAYANIYEYD